MEVKWSYLGVVHYKEALDLMNRLRDRASQSSADCILLLQHHPVITRGFSEKGTDSGLLLPRADIESKGIQVVDADRGGKTTFHGPGQLVGYFIIDLKRRHDKIKNFVAEVLEMLRQVLDSYGIEAEKDEKAPGLYVNGEKIAFMGFKVKNNVTTHGFALNVNNELEPFSYVEPCGIPGARITSMEKVGGQRYSLYDVYWRFITYFADMHGDDLEEVFVEDFDIY